jgi:pimeloyl-ACP methyl ester carboxylesterase
MMRLTARFAPDRLIAQSLAALPEPDRAVLARPQAQKAFANMLLESMRRGTHGPQVDTALMVSPWDFDPAEIQMRVQMWQGELDQDAPPAMSRWVSAAVRHSQIEFYPADGHLSALTGHIEEILAALTA